MKKGTGGLQMGGLATALLAVGICSTAEASGTARISTMGANGKRVLANVDFTSPGNLRSSAVLHGQPTLIMRDGRAYAQIGRSEQPIADLASADRAGVTRPNAGDEVIGSLISLKNTGRKETRAGFVADIYDMSFYDRTGRRRVEQIAVSNDPRARELTDLWKSVNEALLPNAIPAVGDLQKQLQANGLGLLRFSFRYQVDRLDQAVRLPPVQAYAPRPQGEGLASLGAAPLLPPVAAAEAVPVIDESLGKRVRKFTQGSILGFLFGG